MLWHWQSKLKTTEYKAEILVKRSLEWSKENSIIKTLLQFAYKLLGNMSK